MRRSKAWPAFLILIQSLLYGVGDVCAKSAYEGRSLWFLLSIRYLIASSLFLLLARGRFARTLRTVSPAVWLPPGLCMGFAYLLSNYALTATAATNMAFLRSLSALLAPLLALVCFRRKYGWRHVVLQVFVVAGLYLLCAEGGLSAFGVGDAAALLAALMIAGSLVFGQRAMERMDAVTLSAVQTLCTLAVCLVCFFAGGAGIEPVPGPLWAALAYLAVGCTIAGTLLQNAALRISSSRSVAMIQCVYPVITALFAFLILHEALRPMGLVGAGIILLCVFLESALRDGEDAPPAAELSQAPEGKTPQLAKIPPSAAGPGLSAAVESARFVPGESGPAAADKGVS